MTNRKKVGLSLWASGNGSNVENIIRHFQNKDNVRIAQIIVSNKNAYAIKRAIRLGIPYRIITRAQLKDPSYILPALQNDGTDLIILAGFLWKIPDYLLSAYPRRIINIHPSLLPKYGGKNMYGDNVHKAVLKNKETESGITIHRINAEYDEGPVILQKSFSIAEDENLDTIKEKIHKLEAEWYATTIEKLIEEDFA